MYLSLTECITTTVKVDNGKFVETTGRAMDQKKIRSGIEENHFCVLRQNKKKRIDSRRRKSLKNIFR